MDEMKHNFANVQNSSLRQALTVDPLINCLSTNNFSQYSIMFVYNPQHKFSVNQKYSYRNLPSARHALPQLLHHLLSYPVTNQ